MEYINLAIKEATKAYRIDEVPVGCVIIKEGKVLSKAYNKKIKNNDVTSHAEINAIRKAEKKENTWHLDDAIMYVTLEPCPMCAGAIKESRIKKVVVGTRSNIEDNQNILRQILGNQTEIEYLDNKECSDILSKFFSELRK